jgi:hypothetical protein
MRWQRYVDAYMQTLNGGVQTRVALNSVLIQGFPPYYAETPMDIYQKILAGKVSNAESAPPCLFLSPKYHAEL